MKLKIALPLIITSLLFAEPASLEKTKPDVSKTNADIDKTESDTSKTHPDMTKTEQDTSMLHSDTTKTEPDTSMSRNDEIVLEDDEIVLEDDEIILEDDEIILDENDEIVLEDDFETDIEGEIEEAPIEKMPEQTKFVDAIYPKEIYSKGVEGIVLLELLVNDSGTVDSATVITSLEPTLDSNALEAAKQFLFTPATILVKDDSDEKTSGEEVSENIAVYIQYEYRFSLDEVVEKTEEFVNMKGTLYEAGTRNLIPDAMIVAEFTDSSGYSGIDVPLTTYLKKIGSFDGQSFEEGAIVVVTDSVGNFEFKSLPVGVVKIRIPKSGFERFETEEQVITGEQTELKLRMTKLSYDNYEITAYYKGEEKEVSRRTLNINEVKKIPGLGGDAIKVVQAMPGVARPTAGGGDLIVRGANSWDSKFLLDGTDLPLLYHFGGLKSTYNSEALETIDFYPGGYGTRYGNVTGGVVEIHSRPAAKDRWHGMADVSTLDASFFVEGPVNDKLSLMVSGRRSYFGELMKIAIDLSEEDLGAQITPFYWDYITRADFTPNKKHLLSISSFGSFDSLEVFIDDADLGNEELEEATNAIRNKMFFNKVALSWDWKITDRLKNSLDNSWNYSQSDFAIFGFARSEMGANELNLRDNLAFKVSDKLLVNGGVDIAISDNDIYTRIMDGNGLTQTDSILDWKFGTIGAYVNFEIKPIERLLLIPGLRYDYYRELIHDGSVVPEFADYGDWNNKGIAGDPSFRLSSRFKLNDKHTIKGAVGNYNQTPQPMGQAIHPQWGVPSLPTTKAAHFVIGEEWQITDLISLDVQGYYNKQWDVPRDVDSADYANSPNQPLYFPDGEGRNYGLEVMLRHDQSARFFGWVAYTLSKSERTNPNENGYDLFSNDQTHNLQILGSWTLRKQWETGFRARYTTGNPTNSIVSKEWNVDEDYMRPEVSDKYDSRLDPFFQLDLRVEKKFITARTVMSLYLDLQNALFFAYSSPEFEIYDDFYIDKTVFTMPIVPALGFSIKF
jgi:TonB family protein